jgi:hypothetical protein
MAGDIAVKLANLLKGRSGFNIAHDDQDHIRRCVPLVRELLQHRPSSFVERGPRSQRIVCVGRTRKHVLVETINKFLRRIRQIPSHLLLNRAPLLVPLRLRVVDPAHARRLRLERHVNVRRRHRLKVLRDVLLRVGVVIAAHQREDGGRLVGAHAFAAAERHMLLRVRHARKTVGRLIAADHKVGLHRHHRRQRVADDHHAHAIRQSRASGRSIGRLYKGRSGKRQERDQKRNSQATLQNNPPGERCPLGMVKDRDRPGPRRNHRSDESRNLRGEV